MRPARLTRLYRAPAVRAALIQCLAFIALLALVFVLARLGLPVSYLGAALLQGLLAALLTWKFGLASWWRPIQLLFPLALYGASALQLPPLMYLLIFLVLLGLYWSTFRTQVPLYPSGPATWAAVDALLPPRRPLSVIDIGSGMGGFVLDLARRRPDSVITGIELAPLPWLFSLVRACLAGSRAQFVRGDYETLNFAAYDAVFAYLSPAAMPALWRKAAAEMRQGTLLISYEFSIPSHPPDKTIAATAVGPALYVWCF